RADSHIPRIPVAATNVLVVGIGRSGQATARYLLNHAHTLAMQSLTLVDSAQTKTLEAFAAQLKEESRASGNDVEISTHFGASTVGESDQTRYDLCVITPGLAPHTALAQSAHQASKEVLSETELAYRLSDAAGTWIAVTGTNGKTTTVELAQSILAAGIDDQQVFSVGNIGLPALAVLDSAHPRDIFVAEVSSFQAARLAYFRPQVAALLNLSSDHLDWHSDIASYAADKCKIFAQSAAGDLVIVPENDQLHPAARPLIIAAIDAAASRGATILRVTTDSLQLPLAATELALTGTHNLINACFATEIGRSLAISEQTIADVLRSFRASPHRMQEVGSYGDVLYVNDSKATNPGASMQALTAYLGRDMILLLGGSNKGADFHDLAQASRARARLIICFGQARTELKAAFDALAPAGADEHPAAIHCCDTLSEAVDYAIRHATAGQVVMLSPANASYDEFDDYAARGAAFTQMVTTLAESVQRPPAARNTRGVA
ncbi:MAG: UDP-N-acetylmuramoyl-L-alanine--D-glutamate ligase, partial [Coriobacteriia bacterium]|nr:UDP-N-acetylmuramoyl-L-alanine--D-glutamate ligase [Coriobacteriia bacterium]